jgi:hypothetical protein
MIFNRGDDRLRRATETGIRPACPASTRSYGVDAAFMSFHVHGRGIHIV